MGVGAQNDLEGHQTFARKMTLGEFTQYPFFVRFRPFFYVFASP